MLQLKIALEAMTTKIPPCSRSTFIVGQLRALLQASPSGIQAAASCTPSGISLVAGLWKRQYGRSHTGSQGFQLEVTHNFHSHFIVKQDTVQSSMCREQKTQISVNRHNSYHSKSRTLDLGVLQVPWQFKFSLSTVSTYAYSEFSQKVYMSK